MISACLVFTGLVGGATDLRNAVFGEIEDSRDEQRSNNTIGCELNKTQQSKDRSPEDIQLWMMMVVLGMEVMCFSVEVRSAQNMKVTCGVLPTGVSTTTPA